MTFSILARDPEDGSIGCAAATGNLAVGAWVLRAAANVGAVATQGQSVSSLWGDQGLELLHQGKTADDIVDQLTSADTGRDHRQLAVLDRSGQVASFTGTANKAARGMRSGNNWVISGNWLESEIVLDAMAAEWSSKNSSNWSMADRLLAILQAGHAAGGDERGCLSAALKVVHKDRPALDLRVDYDDAPITRLAELHQRTQEQSYRRWVEGLPTLKRPEQC